MKSYNDSLYISNSIQISLFVLSFAATDYCVNNQFSVLFEVDYVPLTYATRRIMSVIAFDSSFIIV